MSDAKRSKTEADVDVPIVTITHGEAVGEYTAVIEGSGDRRVRVEQRADGSSKMRVRRVAGMSFVVHESSDGARTIDVTREDGSHMFISETSDGNSVAIELGPNQRWLRYERYPGKPSVIKAAVDVDAGTRDVMLQRIRSTTPFVIYHIGLAYEHIREQASSDAARAAALSASIDAVMSVVERARASTAP